MLIHFNQLRTPILFTRKLCSKDQKGAALLAVIIGIMVIASIGTAIISTTTSTSRLEIGSADTVAGYYLAESGLEYAMTFYDDDTGLFNSDFKNLLQSETTFRLPNGVEEFRLDLSGSNPPTSYTLSSTGVPDRNADTERTITYTITP